MRFLLFAATLIASSGASAAPLVVKDAVVEWQASLTVGGAVKATGAKASGTIESLADGRFRGTFECALSPMTTDNETRDGHMREKYLDVAKFPTAKLVIEPSPATGWKGALTLKGETHPVTGTGDLAADGTFVAAFTVDLDDFKAIGAPTWHEVAMRKDVQVTVKGKLGG